MLTKTFVCSVVLRVFDDLFGSLNIVSKMKISEFDLHVIGHWDDTKLFFYV